MRTSASVLQSLLDADLEAAGHNGFHQYPGQSPVQFAMSNLQRTFLKKYLPGTQTTTPAADLKALNLFLEVNEHCKNFCSKDLPRTELEEIALGEAKAFLYNFFYPRPIEKWTWVTPYAKEQKVVFERDFLLNSEAISKFIGVGPGASVGSLATDFYTKLGTSKLTFTDPALHVFYVQTIKSYPLWSECETYRSSQVGTQLVSGSRLSFVPKTTEISRTICTEPILNMLFQKGVQGVLESRLVEVVGIDLSIQPTENAELARIGSLCGKFGTIDLSSASDSLSRSVIQDFFPSRVVDILNRYRSPKTTLPGGTEIELHMVSSMGNAFTFPLQTIFFSAIVIGAYKAYGIKPVHFRGHSLGSSNFAVFGDDIIVDTRVYDLVCRLLHLTGFRVNHDKSFNTGLFRESCGHDYFHGYNVRGVYLKNLRDANDYYSAINRLNRWSARHGIILNLLVSFLASKCRFLPVPEDEDDSCGIKIPLWLLTKRVINRDTGGILYRYSKLNTLKVAYPPVRESVKRSLGWFENPSGLYLAFMAGSIRNGFVGFRAIDRHANIRRRWSSRWDFISSARGESREFGENWKVFVALNLGKI